MFKKKNQETKTTNKSVFDSQDFKNQNKQNTTNNTEEEIIDNESLPFKPEEDNNQSLPFQPEEDNNQSLPFQPEEENKIDPNKTFFEKFEKSKKEFAKEKKQAKKATQKSLAAKAKMLGFENRLRDDTYFKRFWILIIFITVAFLAYVCVVEGFLGPYFNSASNTSKFSIAVNVYGDLTKTSIIFSGIVICLIPLPYCFLLSSWFIGINNVIHSKSFIYTNITILVISSVFIFFIIILSSIVFNQVIYFLPLS